MIEVIFWRQVWQRFDSWYASIPGELPWEVQRDMIRDIITDELRRVINP